MCSLRSVTSTQQVCFNTAVVMTCCVLMCCTCLGGWFPAHDLCARAAQCTNSACMCSVRFNQCACCCDKMGDVWGCCCRHSCWVGSCVFRWHDNIDPALCACAYPYPYTYPIHVLPISISISYTYPIHIYPYPHMVPGCLNPTTAATYASYKLSWALSLYAVVCNLAFCQLFETHLCYGITPTAHAQRHITTIPLCRTPCLHHLPLTLSLHLTLLRECSQRRRWLAVGCGRLPAPSHLKPCGVHFTPDFVGEGSKLLAAGCGSPPAQCCSPFQPHSSMLKPLLHPFMYTAAGWSSKSSAAGCGSPPARHCSRRCQQQCPPPLAAYSSTLLHLSRSCWRKQRRASKRLLRRARGQVGAQTWRCRCEWRVVGMMHLVGLLWRVAAADVL